MLNLIKRFHTLILITFLISYTDVSAQLTKYGSTQVEDQIEIPFQYINGFIIVDIVFQKVMPLKFILDTGAGHTILLKREYAEVLKIPYQKKIKLLGADMSKDVYAYICNGMYIQMVNLQPVKHNIIVMEDDFLYLEEYVGTKIDGILGAEFFKGMVLNIDYKMGKLTLIHPKIFNTKKLKDYKVFDIEIINNKPYLNCITEVNQGFPVNTRLLLDTGAGLSALFHNNSDSLMTLKSQIIKGNLGKGLGGNIEGYTGKIHQLKIGEIYFNNMISSFQALDKSILEEEKIVRNGLLGNLLLERFNMTLDLFDKKLYLKPRKNYNKAFEFDKSGLTVFAFGERLNQYYIKFVMEESPAAESGLLPGDIILKIGNFSYKWYSLRQVNKIFSGKSGKKIKLKINRDGKKLKKEIILKDLI